MNYRLKTGITILSFLLCLPAIAATLDGFAANYNSGTEENNPQLSTSVKIPNHLLSDDYILSFESTTISEIQKKFGGEIKTSPTESWVCYNAESENITYWFISSTEMEDGFLSTVAIAPLNKLATCDLQTKAINISLSKTPSIGATLNKVIAFYGVKNNKNQGYLNVYNLLEDKSKKDEVDTVNLVEYYFNHGKVSGIFISQMSSM